MQYPLRLSQHLLPCMQRLIHFEVWRWAFFFAGQAPLFFKVTYAFYYAVSVKVRPPVYLPHTQTNRHALHAASLLADSDWGPPSLTT